MTSKPKYWGFLVRGGWCGILVYSFPSYMQMRELASKCSLVDSLLLETCSFATASACLSPSLSLVVQQSNKPSWPWTQVVAWHLVEGKLVKSTWRSLGEAGIHPLVNGPTGQALHWPFFRRPFLVESRIPMNSHIHLFLFPEFLPSSAPHEHLALDFPADILSLSPVTPADFQPTPQLPVA